MPCQMSGTKTSGIGRSPRVGRQLPEGAEVRGQVSFRLVPEQPVHARGAGAAVAAQVERPAPGLAGDGGGQHLSAPGDDLVRGGQGLRRWRVVPAGDQPVTVDLGVEERRRSEPAVVVGQRPLARQKGPDRGAGVEGGAVGDAGDVDLDNGEDQSGRRLPHRDPAERVGGDWNTGVRTQQPAGSRRADLDLGT